MASEEFGKYSKEFISDITADLSSKQANFYKNVIFKYPLEGVYIYSFEEGKMIYADGWEDVVGIPSNEISMLGIVNMTCPRFAPFVHDINDKALKFLHSNKSNLTQYSFTIETKIMHQNGSEIPVVAKVKVHETFLDGSLKSIMGRFQVDFGLKFGKIMRYAAYGPEKEKFEMDLNANLFYPFQISQQEADIISLLSSGQSYDEISTEINQDSAHIEKRVKDLMKRFEVKNETHLIAFAIENNLIDSRI
jgi:DNA-binding CsgD family transcriptional regulator